MLRTDAREQNLSSVDPIDDNVSSITMDVITEIERELLDTPYDMISMVFLLYDVPDTALQRLLFYQRVSKDVYSTNMNLLHEWIQMAKSKSIWRQEFLEALLICQLYGIVRKLGYNIQNLKRLYQPDNIHYNMYINPTKKILYKLCEKIDTNNLNTLKRSLNTFNIDTTEYASCELVFLKLMSEKVITLNDFKYDEKMSHKEFNFEKLIKLLHKLPGLESFANELQVLKVKARPDYIGQPAAASSPNFNQTSDVYMAMQPLQEVKQHINQDFASEFDILAGLNIEDIHIIADSKSATRECYPIKDPKNLGVCLIINQEEFHLCDQSIEDGTLRASLSRRTGSTYDKIALERTMSSQNFKVIAKDNLNHTEMYSFIRKSIIEHVSECTSIFMMCILSHGVRDHVFAADSVKVKVEDIQKLLDSEEARCLRGKPKVLILQACQVDDVSQLTMVADSPRSSDFFIGKSDFLVYWATSPEYEAFRAEEAGSIFIQRLCDLIQKEGKREHLQDIFTKNNFDVHYICSKRKKHQMPFIKTSLRKKLYLHVTK